jgi:hypothetical protein
MGENFGCKIERNIKAAEKEPQKMQKNEIVKFEQKRN